MYERPWLRSKLYAAGTGFHESARGGVAAVHGVGVPGPEPVHSGSFDNSHISNRARLRGVKRAQVCDLSAYSVGERAPDRRRFQGAYPFRVSNALDRRKVPPD